MRPYPKYTGEIPIPAHNAGMGISPAILDTVEMNTKK
jgi:hypothetical protein